MGEPAPTEIMQKRDRKLKSGDGAGFLGYLFGGTDMGEPAPTEIMQKRDRVNSLVFFFLFSHSLLSIAFFFFRRDRSPTYTTPLAYHDQDTGISPYLKEKWYFWEMLLVLELFLEEALLWDRNFYLELSQTLKIN